MVDNDFLISRHLLAVLRRLHLCAWIPHVGNHALAAREPIALTGSRPRGIYELKECPECRPCLTLPTRCALTDEHHELVASVRSLLDPGVRARSNEIAHPDQHVEENGGRIGFRVRLDSSHDAPC